MSCEPPTRPQADGSTHARIPVRLYLADYNASGGSSADLPLSVKSFSLPSTTHNIRIDSNHQGKQIGNNMAAVIISLLNVL